LARTRAWTAAASFSSATPNAAASAGGVERRQRRSAQPAGGVGAEAVGAAVDDVRRLAPLLDLGGARVAAGPRGSEAGGQLGDGRGVEDAAHRNGSALYRIPHSDRA
jgi:hypothetical protein